MGSTVGEKKTHRKKARRVPAVRKWVVEKGWNSGEKRMLEMNVIVTTKVSGGLRGKKEFKSKKPGEEATVPGTGRETGQCQSHAGGKRIGKSQKTKGGKN